MLRLLLVSVLFIPQAVRAADLGSLTASDVAASRAEAPLPKAAKAAGKYADGMLQVGHLLALTGPKALYTMMADTPAKFEEFKAMWQPVIKKAGLKALPPEYSAGFGALKYETTGGLAIRSFLCDTAHMPVSEKEMESFLTEVLNSEGLKVVGSYGIPADPNIFPKPTVNLYYLTSFNENQDRERQLRYLGVKSKAVKFDLDVLEAAGIKIAAKYGGNALFYVGPRVGVALAAAKDQAMVEKQVAYHKDLINKRGEKLLAVRTDRLELTDGAAYLTKVYYLK